LHYTTENVAKKDGLELAASKTRSNTIPQFKGLAVINSAMLSEINNSGIGVTAQIKASPMNKDGEYIAEGTEVYRCDRGKPYHADLIFSEKTNDGEPNTKIRSYCNEILKKVSAKNLFFQDEHPTNKKWLCGKLHPKVEDAFRRTA
jgi:hypothetical protein